MRSRSVLFSFEYAIQGVVYALRTQRNMRLHVLAAVAVMVLALFIRIGALELMMLSFAVAFVLFAELVNTALEAAVDVATEQYEPLAKVAKDVSAGAVLVAALNALVVGYLVFFTRLTAAVDTVLGQVRSAPVHLTVIAFGLVLVAVIVTKALNREDSFLSGGWPSGHTALAFAAATAAGYVTESAKATLFALFLALLVAQSRVEGEFHTIPQALLGALLGILVTTAVFQLVRV